MHSTSRTWKSSNVKKKEVEERTLKARLRTCAKSPFFTEHFNFQQHETIMNKEKELFAGHQTVENVNEVAITVAPFRGRTFQPSTVAIFDNTYPYATLGPGHISPVSKREGKYLQATFSAVLCQATIWQEDWVNNKHVIWPEEPYRNSRIISPFPTHTELKFEGADRVSTLTEHRRAFPLPREPRNDTVAWSKIPKAVVHNFDLLSEHLQPTEEDIFFHHHEVELPDDEDLNPGGEDAEPDPYEGVKARRLIGDGLLDALDPKNVFF